MAVAASKNPRQIPYDQASRSNVFVVAVARVKTIVAWGTAKKGDALVAAPTQPTAYAGASMIISRARPSSGCAVRRMALAATEPTSVGAVARAGRAWVPRRPRRRCQRRRKHQVPLAKTEPVALLGGFCARVRRSGIAAQRRGIAERLSITAPTFWDGECALDVLPTRTKLTKLPDNIVVSQNLALATRQLRP